MHLRFRLLAGLAAVALIGTACANATPTGPGSSGSPGAIGHPADPSTPLLTIAYEGGFVAPSMLFERLPIFALYGDGSVMTPGVQDAIYPGAALPPIFVQTLSEDGIQAVLAAGLAAHLDRDGDYSDLGNMGIADAATTVFTFTVGGQTHRVTAYALDMTDQRQQGQPQDMFEMRSGLSDLVRAVSDLPSLVPAGSLGDPVAYDGASAQLLIGPYVPDAQLTQEPVDWPLGTPLASLGDRVAALGQDMRCAVVSGQDWSDVRTLATRANQLTPWVSGGDRYAITFRPLLPDEPGCPALA